MAIVSPLFIRWDITKHTFRAYIVQFDGNSNLVKSSLSLNFHKIALYIYIYIRDDSYRWAIGYVEVRPVRLDKTHFFHVFSILWMHNMDTENAYTVKAWWQLYNNDASSNKQILEATSHQTAAKRPLPSYHYNNPNKTKKSCWTLQEK